MGAGAVVGPQADTATECDRKKAVPDGHVTQTAVD